MPAAVSNPVAVRGLRELQAAFAKADRDTRLGVRKTLMAVAEPVRATAEALAVQNISNIGPKWGKMRTGVSRSLIYVAPRQRGRMTRQNRARYARPNFANRLMADAMEPALRRHRHGIEASVERAMDRVADDFNHAGPL